MVNVDVPKLREIKIEFDKVIENTEKNDNNVVHYFNELSELWQDNNSVRLYDSFNAEKNKYSLLLNDMKKYSNIYSTLIDGYGFFGNKIKCDESNSSYVLYKIDVIIEQLKYLNVLYDNIGDISFYHNSGLIYDEKEQINSMLDFFTNLRNNIDSDIKSIINIEKNVSDLLENVSIEKFIVNNYECEE